MATPGTIPMVQEPDGCTEGLGMMYVNGVVLVGGAIRPLNVAQWAMLGAQNLEMGALSPLN